MGVKDALAVAMLVAHPIAKAELALVVDISAAHGHSLASRPFVQIGRAIPWVSSYRRWSQINCGIPHLTGSCRHGEYIINGAVTLAGSGSLFTL